MAVPALQQLYAYGFLKAVVVPRKNKELYALLCSYLLGTNVPVISTNRIELESDVTNIITEKKITACWMMTFPYIIPASLLSVIPGGFINFHYALLPEYRGVNPVINQLINLESFGGITIHQADEGIDTGPIIMKEKIPIEENETFGMHMDKLAILGSSIAVKLAAMYMQGSSLPLVAQDKSLAVYHPRVTAKELMINWKKMNSRQVVGLINACNPWNKGAGAVINNMGIHLVFAEFTNETTTASPGMITAINPDGIKVACADNSVVNVIIIYTPQGFFPARKLVNFGVKINDHFYVVV